MDPITLRLQEELHTQLKEESEKLGYSSRSEYIRHILQHRSQIREQLSNLSTDSVDNRTGQQEETSEIKQQIEDLEQRMEIVEESLAKNTAQRSDYREKSSAPDLDSKLEESLNNWLMREGPGSDQARSTLLNAAKILSKEGPLSTQTLKKQLYDQDTMDYNSSETMWQATIQKYHDQVPGFEKHGRGQYDFTPQKARSLLKNHKSVYEFES